MLECWFLGTLIYWVGYTSQHGIPASSTYAIDGQTPISFPVPASPDTYFNQILFKTEQLSFGQHKLADTYFGNSTTVPLALNYFVSHGALSSNKTHTTTSVTLGSLSNPTISSMTTIHRKPTEAVIGGLGLIFLLIVLFFFVRSRKNRRSRSQVLSEMSCTDPSPDVVTPFTVLLQIQPLLLYSRTILQMTSLFKHPGTPSPSLVNCSKGSTF